MVAQTIEDYKTLFDVIDFLPVNSRPNVVAISGFAGSGKTTLAQKLAQDLPGAIIVPTDDFIKGDFRARSDNWDCIDRQRIIDEILRPAQRGNAMSYHTYDWQTGSSNKLIDLGKPPCVLLEGIGIIHPDLVPYFNFSIWLDIPEEEAARHGMERDKEILHANNDAYWQDVWIPNDLDYFNKYYPNQLVDYLFKLAPA